MFYTVTLTHTPGMREDETIDLMNDEVRIYLTSSQEVYQEDDVTDVSFQQRVGHRTQVVIDTNVASTSGTDPDASDSGNGVVGRAAAKLKAPTPYVYVAYSTVNPTQASPIASDGSTYQVVCPVCTHSAYCAMTSGIIDGTTFGPSHTVPSDTGSHTSAELDNGEDFDGCYQITYKGYAPIYDECAAGPVEVDGAGATQQNLAYVGYSWKRPAGIFTPAKCTVTTTGDGTDVITDVSEHLIGNKQQCLRKSSLVFIEYPEVGTCIDDQSGEDITATILSANQLTEVKVSDADFTGDRLPTVAGRDLRQLEKVTQLQCVAADTASTGTTWTMAAAGMAVSTTGNGYTECTDGGDQAATKSGTPSSASPAATGICVETGGGNSDGTRATASSECLAGGDYIEGWSLATCEGLGETWDVAKTVAWTDAFCTFIMVDKVGSATTVVYDNDDVRGDSGVQDSSQPVDKTLCETEGGAEIILPSPGLKSARQYSAQGAEKPTAASPNKGFPRFETATQRSSAPCRPTVSGFDGVTGIITLTPMVRLTLELWPASLAKRFAARESSAIPG